MVLSSSRPSRLSTARRAERSRGDPECVVMVVLQAVVHAVRQAHMPGEWQEMKMSIKIPGRR
jgi:hypothetical protein